MNKTKKYNHLEMQKKWDKVWQAQKIYQPDLDNSKKPYYCLYMFPYPSAEGLHVGHAFSGTGADVYARFVRMKGYDVFQPMGFDAFGIHSENFALKIGDHPQNLIDRATKHFRQQFDALGFSYDWNHSVNTSDPSYYKWTQWLFIQLFKAGLAEKKKAEVNWCPSCKTVLADEQVLQKSPARNASQSDAGGKIKNQKSKIGDEGTRDEERVGVCERCGTEVEMKELEQWFFKITIYADRLLEGLSRIDWTEKVKLAQNNWIGRSEGLLIKFKISNLKLKIGESEDSIEVFTTKPGTVDGATFIVLSPEHPTVAKLLNIKYQTSNIKLNEIKEYVERARNKSADDIEKEKTGVFTGLYAENPVTGKEIPVWVSNYVLAGYGTGAIMAVPYADERDKEFAKEFDLPIAETTFDSKPKGEKQTHYHLRDWLISRQRYWGAPIPMIFCKKDGWQPVAEEDLPVLLPYIENFRPLRTGVSPLDQDKNFVNTTCPVCGGPAKRETDVCDTFLDSSWYFLRYPVSDFDTVPFASKHWGQEAKVSSSPIVSASSNVKRQTIRASKTSDEDDQLEKAARRAVWLPVNSYIGGAEHSVLHLLYSRFITKVLFDLKFLDFDEPFTKFRAHGLLIKEGAKMSKSKGNVINPDEYINKYGADALRCYLMFLGPFNQGGDFRDSGIEGMEKFLKRVRKLVESSVLVSENQSKNQSAKFFDDPRIEKSLNKTIKGVEDDIESLRYNTAIAKIMEFLNDLKRSKAMHSPKYLKPLVFMLAPFAPYLAEELWEMLNSSDGRKWKIESRTSKVEDGRLIHPQSSTLKNLSSTVNLQSSLYDSVHLQPWPTYDENKLSEDEVVIAVQVNGKLRAVLRIKNQVSSKDEVVAGAREDQRVSKYIEGKKILKVIYVEGKILNFVV